MVWLRDGLAIGECPVSFVTGESMAWLEDFYAHEAMGNWGDILEWPGRRVDAFLVLKTELRKLERSADA